MEYLILGTIIFSTFTNIFVTRIFLKSLSKKIDQKYTDEPQTEVPSLPETNGITVGGKSIPFPMSVNGSSPMGFDKPSKNLVMDNDNNEIDFDENVPIAVPPAVKFEVEGGDTVAPPNFPVKNG